MHRSRPATAGLLVAAAALVGVAAAAADGLVAGRVDTAEVPRTALVRSSPTIESTTPMTTTVAPPKPAPTTSTSTTTTVTTALEPPATAASTTAPLPQLSGCAAALPAQMAGRNHASQLITVVAPYYGSTYATLTAWRLSGTCWVTAFGPFQARVGYNGISTDKHEGDGTTPAGLYDFESTMYGNAANPGVHFDYQSLSCGDWWDEDSASPYYNRFVVVPCSDTHPAFDNGASEALWTETTAYPSFAVINYNPDDIPGKGSAIFLHADIGGPTAGCVSLPLGDLDEVLDWMLPADNPSIAIGTTATITAY